LTINDAPFAGLTPEKVLAAVDRVGFITDGRFLALNSYENRVYQVHIEQAPPVIVKFYRPQRWSDEAIQEEHDYAMNAASLDLPIVPPLEFEGQSLLRFESYRYAVFKRQGGHWPELGVKDDRVLLGRSLGRLHQLGATSRFQQRPTLAPLKIIEEAAKTVLAANQLASHQVDRYVQICEQILDIVSDIEQALGAVSTIRIHGDCHRGNILWTDQGPHFVDCDDAVNGPAVQDIWMLLAGNPDECRGQWNDFMEGYEQFRPFPHQEWAYIPALRLTRMVHYAAWLQRRMHDPAFPKAFPWFGTARFWDEHIQSLSEEWAKIAHI
jgi:Ser/Thr protein kinase RdoA (MazF antagonist)